MKTFFCFALLSAFSAMGSEYIFHSQRNPGNSFKLNDSKSSKDIDLGEDWDGTLEIIDAKEPFSVEMKYQTSLHLNDEGPHLDLTDWLHHDSSWVKLEEKEKGQFEIPDLGNQTVFEFPFVSKADLLKKVKSLGGEKAKRWLPVAKLCQGPSLMPCSVSISKVSFRIFKKESKELIKELTLVLPMGC